LAVVGLPPSNLAKLVPGLLWPSRTDIRLDGLLLGCMAALLLANAENRKWMMQYVTTPVWAGLMVIYALFQIIPGRHLYSIWESAILATVVVWTVIRPDTLAGKILESNPLKWIGRLSYSLYLWQQLFRIRGGCKPLAWQQEFPFGIVMTFLVAALSYKYIERPLIRVGHRLAPPQTPGRTDLAEAI